MVDIRRFLDLEAALSRKLRMEWRKQATALWAEMDGYMAKGQFDAARKLVDTIDFGAIGEKYRGLIKYILWATALFGARLANRKPLLSVVKNEALLTHIVNNFILILHYQTTKVVKAKAMELIDEREAASKVKKAPTMASLLTGGVAVAEALPLAASQAAAGFPTMGLNFGRFVQAFTSFMHTGDAHLQLISSLHSSRLAVYGAVAEADALGIQTYKLQAVLDSRTSDYCRMIDGEEFDVAEAAYAIGSVLWADNPEDVKQLQPWPDQSAAGMAELQEMTREELVSRGYHIPPFHPHCRTILVPLRTEAPEEAEIEAAAIERERAHMESEAEDKHMQTAEDFTSLGFAIVADELEKWNRTVGQPPLTILAGLTGQDIEDTLAGSKAKFFNFKKDGSAVFKATGAFAGADSDVSVAQVFDPYLQTLAITQMDFRKATYAATATAMRAMYAGAIANATALHAKTITVSTNGKFGLFAHASFGFTPATAVQWSNLKNDLLMDLSEGGPLYYLWSVLSTQQAGTLKLILNSTDPKGLWAIADLPYDVNGVPLGRLLLTDREMQVSLVLDDEEAMDRYGDYFP